MKVSQILLMMKNSLRITEAPGEASPSITRIGRKDSSRPSRKNLRLEGTGPVDSIVPVKNQAGNTAPTAGAQEAVQVGLVTAPVLHDPSGIGLRILAAEVSTKVAGVHHIDQQAGIQGLIGRALVDLAKIRVLGDISRNKDFVQGRRVDFFLLL